VSRPTDLEGFFTCSPPGLRPTLPSLFPETRIERSVLSLDCERVSGDYPNSCSPTLFPATSFPHRKSSDECSGFPAPFLVVVLENLALAASTGPTNER